MPFFEAIPAEQQAMFIGSIITLILSALAGAGYLFRLWVLQKIAEDKVQMQSRFDDEKAKREREHLEVQAQLDSTQSSREVIHMQSIELIESRNAFLEIIKAMREDGQKRDEQSVLNQKEATIAYQGIQANTAATLEFLKLHAENDNVLQIRQERMIAQNEGIHSKLLDITSSLDTVISKVDSLSVGQLSDKRVLENIQGALNRLHDAIERIEQVERLAETRPLPELLIATVVTETNENNKEFTAKENSNEQNT